ncbi:hypothetical protein GOBAR_DD25814 [Gossypium barbadense]|nr:hypothetical protein GOBAR_DD25814 [Gossypium barbadense]
MTINTIVNGYSTENQKTKKSNVIFVVGATATGKSKLSVYLAVHFNGEIINSDKIQVYKGLDIVTNKVTNEETRGIPHHLLGIVDDPDQDFSADDFRRHGKEAIESVLSNGKVPIVAGGSNSYVEHLERVDQMVAAGLVDEVREIFVANADYGRGIRRAIGLLELEAYFTVEKDSNVDEATKAKILANCIEETKKNTLKLIDSQLGKIRRLREEVGWKLQRVDATAVHEKCGRDAQLAWEQRVLKKSFEIVGAFLN